MSPPFKIRPPFKEFSLFILRQPYRRFATCLAPHNGHEQAQQPLNPQLFFLLLVSPLPFHARALHSNNDEGQDPQQDTTLVCHPRDERPVLLPANKNERGTERHGGSSRITNKQTLASFSHPHPHPPPNDVSSASPPPPTTPVEPEGHPRPDVHLGHQPHGPRFVSCGVPPPPIVVASAHKA